MNPLNYLSNELNLLICNVLKLKERKRLIKISNIYYKIFGDEIEIYIYFERNDNFENIFQKSILSSNIYFIKKFRNLSNIDYLKKANYFLLNKLITDGDGDVDFFKFIIKEYELTDIDIKNNDGYILRKSIIYKRIKIVEYLIENYVFDVNVVRNSSYEAFRYAIKYNYINIVKYLVELGLTLYDIRYNNNEALRWASQGGYIEIVKYLVELGLTLNDIRNNDNEALRYASERGYIEVVKYLVELGLTLNDIRNNNNEALRYASRRGYIEIVKYLVELGLTLNDIRSNNNDAFRKASQGGYIEIVKYLIQQGLNLDDIRDHNNYALLWASFYGRIKIVKYLIKQGLTLEDIKFNDGKILKEVFINKRVEIIKYFIKKGLTLHDIMDKKYELMKKCDIIQYDKFTKDIAECILYKKDKTYNLEYIQKNKNIILQFLSKFNGFTYISELLKYESLFTIQDLMNNNIINVIFENNIKNIIDFTFDQCKNNKKYLNLKDIKESQLLIYASENGYTEIVEFLLNYEENKNRLTIEDIRESDNASLRYASENGHLKIVKLLLNYNDQFGKKLTINDVKSDNNYALKCSLENKHIKIVKYLLKYQDQEKNKSISQNHSIILNDDDNLYKNIYNHVLSYKKKYYKDIDEKIIYNINNFALDILYKYVY